MVISWLWTNSLPESPLMLKSSGVVRVEELVTLAGFCPCLGHRELAKQHVVDGLSHLPSAGVGSDLPNPSAEPWQSNRSDVLSDGFPCEDANSNGAVENEQECGTCSQIGSHRLLKDHRHPHRGCCNQPRDPGVARFDNLGHAHDQFSVVQVGNCILDASLKVCAEVAKVRRIDASIHEAKAVGRTHNGIALQLQDGSAVDTDTFESAAESFPCERKLIIDCGQDDVHRFLEHDKQPSKARLA